MDTNQKPIKLTKKGLPDKRQETSRKNLEKGKSIIKQALKEIKTKKQEPLKVEKVEQEDYSSDNYSTDEEEVELEQSVATKISEVSPTKEVKIETPIIPEDYSFTFEKKLNEQIEKLNNDYNLKISNIEKKTREELEYLKKTNLELKKHLTSNFRTHQGVLNQEMYLKF